MTWVVWLLGAVAALGCVATAASTLAVRRFRAVRDRIGVDADDAGPRRSVTILKPLHGAEPGLEANLRSFLVQDYRGPVQVVFGVSSGADAAIPVVRRLIEQHPDLDLELVVGTRGAHGNGKIRNLIGMAGAIRHDLLVLSDSDMQVGPRYLAEAVGALSRADVGLVTYLYRGGSGPGLWATLSSMAIDYHFLPSLLLGVRLKKARPCMGATMAFSRRTLEAIGGFEAFATCLADDYAIGEAVRATGQRVVLAHETIVHRCTERSFAELYAHELRWARTVRSIDPVGFAGSIVTNPLPFAMLAAVASGFDPLGLAILASTTLSRLVLQWQVERALGLSTGRWLLGPARDGLSLIVFCASFLTNDVEWRGQRFRVASDGSLENLEGLRS